MAALEDNAPYLPGLTPTKELSHIWMRFFIPAEHRVAMANARVLTVVQMKYFAMSEDKLIGNLQRVIKFDDAGGRPRDPVRQISVDMSWNAVWDAARRDDEVTEAILVEARTDPTKTVP